MEESVWRPVSAVFLFLKSLHMHHMVKCVIGCHGKAKSCKVYRTALKTLKKTY